MKLNHNKKRALEKKVTKYPNLNNPTQPNEFNRRNNLFKKVNQTSYNIPIFKNNINIYKQIEKYHQNPNLRINFKIVGEGLKQKILEMSGDEIKIVDEKEISSPVCTTKFTKSMMKKYDFKISGSIHKSIVINNDEDNNNNRKKSNFIQKKNSYELPKNKSELGNSDEQTNNSSNNIIKLNACKKKQKLNNKNDISKNQKKKNNNNINKYRGINRKKPLSDSLEVINQKKKTYHLEE